MIMRFNTFTFLKTIVTFVLFMTLFGCQLTDFQRSETTKSAPVVNETTTMTSYYLWVMKLDKQEVQAEINKLQSKLNVGNTVAKLRLFLLHSLPSSPTYNPTEALSQLEQQALVGVPDTDLAFIRMLKSQLQQQVSINKKLTSQQRLLNKKQKQLKAQSNKLAELELRSQKLQQQITQLKEIERSINDNGTPL